MSSIIKAENIEADVQRDTARKALPKPHRRNASRTAASVVDAAAIVQSARTRAAAILQGAQTAATRIVEEAEERATVLREQSMEEGYREGYARGSAEGYEAAEREGQRRWQEAVEALELARQELEAVRAEALASAERDMVKFAVLIAEKILRAELADPERTLAIARSLLAEVRDESSVTLYLPAELGMHDEGSSRLVEGASGTGVQLVVKSDPTLGLGDVRIETAWGWIDGRAPVRWRRLIEALRRGIDDDDDDDDQ